MFYEVIAVLEEEGAEVVNASFSVVGENIFYTIHWSVLGCLPSNSDQIVKLTEMPSENPPLPWKVKLLTSAATALITASIRRDGTVNRRLFSFFDLKAPANPNPVDGVSSSDHTVDPTRNLTIRLFSPSRDVISSPPLPVIVYFHGGGFAFHSAFTATYDDLCRRISSQIPAYVISVDYRLSPEHRHPAAYDDGLDVLRFLDSTDLIPDLSAVFLAGDSAGGNIAHHVTRMSLTSSFNKLKVIGQIGFQPFFGGEEDTESEKRLNDKVAFGSRERMKWMWRSFLPIGSSLDHEVANVFGPGSGSGKENWSGFPATMVVVGGRDTLQDRQRWYYNGLKEAGVDVRLVEYPNAIHGFYAFKDVQEAGEVMVEVVKFVREVVDSRKMKLVD